MRESEPWARTVSVVPLMKVETMARPRKNIEELAAQIQNLPRKDQVGVLERVLTPNLELELMLKRWHGRTRRHDARDIKRTVNQVTSERRRARPAARRP